MVVLIMIAGIMLFNHNNIGILSGNTENSGQENGLEKVVFQKHYFK